MLMVVFYANYKWLTYRYFVEGKHRYYTIINFIMIVSFAVFLHYWMDFTRDLFQPIGRGPRTPDALDDFLSFVRDCVNFCIFAAAATCIALAQQWYWADKALRNAEAARVAAELGNLRSQINPHFLLNTLNNIYALTAIDHTRAQSAIQQLSNMLRHLLYDNQEQLVSLSDEVLFIENYINLMKIRLPQSVDVKFEKDLENPNTKVAPLLFISLVENAFKHGISSTEPSFIHMSMTQKGNSLCVIIENSNFPKSEKDRSGHGIGLQQVQRRLDLAYYERYEWTKGVSDDGTVYSSTIKITL
ncbi:MAG: sensor histidine kinase [Prevotella sp.]|nr:sensor histidine kinase [Prevotella sp.]